jgi:outer membrane protein assembly factor BamB
VSALRLAGAGLTAALVVGAAGGCATSESSSFGRAGNSSDVAAALARAKPGRGGIVNGTGNAMVFLATTGPSGGARVAAVDLQSGTVVWRHDDEASSRLVVSRPAVVYLRRGRGGGETLVGRDVKTGAVLWQKGLAAGRRRMGFAADGEGIYEVSHAPNNPRRAEVVRYDARSGAVAWREDIEGEAGAPAVRGGIVVVPRRAQYVTLMDATGGRVLADILSREEAASFVRALPEGLFFGSRGIFVAAPETAIASRKSGRYLQAKLPEFVRPVYHWDMYRPEQGDYSAVDRNRLLWRVAARGGGEPAFADARVVAHSFRFFFGLDPATGALRWAYSHPREDAVASEWAGDHVLFVANDGELGALETTSGRRTWRARPGVLEAGFTVRGATFDAEGFTPGGAQGGTAASDEPLERTLASILWDPDKRFGEVKMYAVTELTRLEGPRVTSELLRALESTELPPLVVQKAVEALVARRDQGSLELYSKALRTHHDYAEERRPPRIDVLARAVAVTKAASVVPALIEHLRLPDTDLGAIREIADAALATRHRDAVPAFEDFLLQYRADPAFGRSPAPVQAAAEVLLKLGGPSEKAMLLFIADDPRTVDPLRAYLQRALFAGEAPGGGQAGK